MLDFEKIQNKFLFEKEDKNYEQIKLHTKGIFK